MAVSDLSVARLYAELARGEAARIADIPADVPIQGRVIGASTMGGGLTTMRRNYDNSGLGLLLIAT